ncbi:MAG: hypothetical protein JWP91_1545 [Fibrobacteres bacterium]|nr:hypothetical protein [Fibrobacterota bacterium]
MMRSSRLTLGLSAVILASMAAIAALSGCNLSPGGGTDVGNPEVTARVSGSLVRLDGSPAPLIPVKLRPKAFLTNPDSASAPSGRSVQDGVTDTQGFFTFDSVPQGDYRIEAMDTGSHGAMAEFSADGRASRINLAPERMDTTGSMTGKVNYLGPIKSVFPKVIIAVYGTDRWTAANNAGEFTLSDLPPGKYTLRISTTAGTGFTAMVPETGLTAGGRASVGTVDLGP